MSKLFIILSLFIIAVVSTVPPSPNFNLTDFPGDWNAVGRFNTVEDEGITFFSCFRITVAVVNTYGVTISSVYLDVEQNSMVTDTQNYASDIKTPAKLISLSNPGSLNNFIVTYYDTENGQAILVSPSKQVGLILSRDTDPEALNFKNISQEVLANLSIPLDKITYIYNKNCDAQNLSPTTDFEAVDVQGQYYANAVFTTNTKFQGIVCAAPSFTTNYTYSIVTGTIDFGNDTKEINAEYYVPTFETGILIYSQTPNVSPLVFLYEDSKEQVFLAVLGDRSLGFVLSHQASLPNETIKQMKEILTKNKLNVTNETFYELNSTDCAQDNDSFMDRVSFLGSI